MPFGKVRLCSQYGEFDEVSNPLANTSTSPDGEVNLNVELPASYDNDDAFP
jgi:hypothetical protein